MIHHCQYCAFCSLSWRVYMRHSFESHSSEPNFSFFCGINGCIRRFSNLSTFNSHIRRKHCDDDLDSVQMEALSTATTLSVEAEISDPADNVCIIHSPAASPAAPQPEISPAQPTSVTADDTSYELRKTAALYLLTLKEKYKVTQTAIDFAVGQTKLFVDKIVDGLSSAVGNEVNSITDCDASTVLSVFENIRNPFEGLETQHLQLKYFQEHFGLVQPVSVYLGTSMVTSSVGATSRVTEKRDTFQYVPLLEGLGSLLSNPEIYSEIIKSHSRSDNIIGDYCDAELYKSISLFNDVSIEHSLQLIMYFDELEVCNPLGGQAGIHKLALFYYTLGNLRPELRSTHKAIQLIACVTCDNLKTYGFDEVLAPFIEDVNVLSQEGISVDVSGSKIHFYGTVLLLLADTLAAHQIGGFKVGVSFALRKCRDCLATASEMSNKFLESDFVLRNPTSHDYYCSLLNGVLGSEDSVTYGVNHYSALNKINYFHVANTQLPQDIMHIIFEGVLNLETRLLLSSFVNDHNYFTLDFLNERIANFSYGRVEKRNKPPRPFTVNDINGSKLPLSASAMWSFSILLPLMIGDKIPVDQPLWECYLLLLEIVKYSTARLTSLATAEYLAAVIDQHHRVFKKCYPLISITPKMHYLVHLPRLLVKLGPLVNCWCMRMEAKNSYFKRISQIGNFRNVPYSVALRHQKLLCANLQGTNFFDYEQLQSGPCNSPSKLEDEIEFRNAVVSYISNASSEALVLRPSWIKIYGEEYHQSDFVHVGWQDNDLPIFAKVKDILVMGGFPFLLVEKYKSVGINGHINGYLIERTFATIYIYTANLPYKMTINAHSYIGDSGLYVVLKSHLELLSVSTTVD